MVKRFICKCLLLGIVAVCPLGVMAQDKVEADAGIDLVTGYIWRGHDVGGISVQPAFTLAYKGFSLNAWGSIGFDRDDPKEIDLVLDYTVGGLRVAVADYWMDDGPGFFHYKSGNTAHSFEAKVGYDFGFLNAEWSTYFAGNVGHKADGSKAYSSYMSVTAPFRLGGLDWEATVGATPWESDTYSGKGLSQDGEPMAKGFSVCEVGVKASKTLKVTRSWSLPLFAQLIWNPTTEDAFFVAGLSF